MLYAFVLSPIEKGEFAMVTRYIFNPIYSVCFFQFPKPGVGRKCMMLQ